ncbi:aldose epimerase family protein [Clostridium vincentii]|uniref:Aldose 1-epimerase n=1 Tax=Clostridium vincentii TaxID=52704 RepID=A0A2T0B6X9_9CLOT|nr:aldose epimerase family protein [Clostridium vincentii]PRR79622.1 Aldose 1-epimerase precursor [Clostridium vincentii]
MAIIRKDFGKTKDNIDVNIFSLTNDNGMKVQIVTYGAAVVSIIVPDKNGNFDDVVLGYDHIALYEKGTKYFGASIGRCANRIKDGKFKIKYNEYSLAQNDGNNHLHGGIKGFDKVVWDAKILDNENNVLELSYFSKDGEESYPGNLTVNVTYTLLEDNSLKLEYKAVSDTATIVNLTNHSYFNLSGHGSGNILNHKLMINSDKFTLNDKYSIPTGEVRVVTETPMDFKTLKPIGKEINVDYEQLHFGLGYDHNWMLKSNGNIHEIAAKLVDETTGRVMDVYTTKPALQFYSANFLDGYDIGKGGISYEKRGALCLETQYVPNAINNNKFTSPLLESSEEYNSTTIYKFSIL